MKKNICIVGMLVNEKSVQAPEVQKVLSKYGNLILHRSGIPYSECDRGIINLTVKATQAELEELKGELGKIPGLVFNAMCLAEDAESLLVCENLD